MVQLENTHTQVDSLNWGSVAAGDLGWADEEGVVSTDVGGELGIILGTSHVVPVDI